MNSIAKPANFRDFLEEGQPDVLIRSLFPSPGCSEASIKGTNGTREGAAGDGGSCGGRGGESVDCSLVADICPWSGGTIRLGMEPLGSGEPQK